ncbi:MAG: hypothetical protein R6U61_06710 [Thermoplasmata archaeon]
MRRYISLSGNYWKTLNGLWAVLKESDFRPEEVVLITEKKSMNKAKRIQRDMKILMDSYDLPEEVGIKKVGNSDYNGTSKIVTGLIKDNLEGDNKNALDLTGGSKLMVAAALFTPDTGKIDHIFFLDFDEDDGIELPYPDIPHGSVELKDLVEERRRV